MCAELAGDPLSARPQMWCDGLSPDTEAFDEATPSIRGHAWICFGTEQQSWRFTALLSSTNVKDGCLVTTGLLSDIERTNWVRVDVDAREIELDLR